MNTTNSRVRSRLSILRGLGRTTFALGLVFLASCSASGRFVAVGSVPEWKDNVELPPPDDSWGESGTLSVRLFSPTLQGDTEFSAKLVPEMIQAANQSGMNISRRSDRKKKPQYEIVITENTKEGGFDFNEEAGIWGALGGGVAAGVLTESVGLSVAGAGAGGVIVGLAAGEKKEKFAFLVTLKQYTEQFGEKILQESIKIENAVGGGGRDEDAGNSISHGEKRNSLDRTYFDTKTRSYQMAKLFVITVSGGALSSESTRFEAARATVLEHLPRWIFPTEVY